MLEAVTEGAPPMRKRAPGRVKKARLWKWARAHEEGSDTDRSVEADSDVMEYDSYDEVESGEDLPHTGLTPSGNSNTTRGPPPGHTGYSKTLLDPQGNPLFNPDDLRHPRSAEWEPPGHIAQYVARRMRTPLSKEGRNKFLAECPRPSLPGSACRIPEIDSKIVQFLNKSDWKPKKGLDYSLKGCQDKILDTLGSLSKLYELLDAARAADLALDVDVAIGWVQRAICLLGNANTAMSTERHKAILLKINPKLAAMTVAEPSSSDDGMLFGTTFVKDLGSYVKTFTAIDKAEANMKRMFAPKVFGGAGRSRSRPPGRGFRGSFQANRGSFFPSRGF
ncbi:Hypothetical predicted protein [Pelobates cultripes]|uniref:Uncharacterized protein n=1 Tax=Pelobates cultripes TaxID=61616 RepID=A0AAD1SX58_PELCU|nr:Hypothetical predicted protein [Pelobates cultripes]